MVASGKVGFGMADDNVPVPSKTLEQTVDGRAYTWQVYAPEETVMTCVTLTDNDTGIVSATRHPNPSLRSEASQAWGGARHSRAAGHTPVIMKEMGLKGVDPDQKIDEMFKGYGHASVADMARIMVDLNDTPMHLAMALFNYGTIIDGQEKSTRYQKKFGKGSLHPLRHYVPSDVAAALEDRYQDIGAFALESFNTLSPQITQGYTDFFKPEQGNKGEKGALDARVLDCIRTVLPGGMVTGLSYRTSARDWARTIGLMDGSGSPLYQNLAKQLRLHLAPDAATEKDLGVLADAPTLIRHTEANNVVRENLAALKEYLNANGKLELLRTRSPRTFGYTPQRVLPIEELYTEGERMVAQYICALAPELDAFEALGWAGIQPDNVRDEISAIIYKNHSKFIEMPVQLATTSSMGIVIDGTFGELRDWNRQRAQGRFVQSYNPLLGARCDKQMADGILSHGYGLPIRVDTVDAFKPQRAALEERLLQYYDKVHAFVEAASKELGNNHDHSFIMNILPMAHKMPIWMHADPKQAHYCSWLRFKPGGHENYRQAAYESNLLFSGQDAYLSAMRIPASMKPDFADRTQFFDRS